MLVKLKVLHGSNQGRELPITVPKFLIGRGEGCHLRPQSDMISRQHCVLEISESGVTIEDLGSRNGTLVNGQKTEGKRPLKLGDKLKVGPLEFEVLIDYALGGNKRPKVKDVKDAVARTGSSSDPLADKEVSSWLEEADELEEMRRMASSGETRQYTLSDLEKEALDATQDTIHDAEAATQAPQKSKAPVAKKEKKEPGKLPSTPQQSTKNSQEAAANMLRKFFNRH